MGEGLLEAPSSRAVAGGAGAHRALASGRLALALFLPAAEKLKVRFGKANLKPLPLGVSAPMTPVIPIRLHLLPARASRLNCAVQRPSSEIDGNGSSAGP